MPMKFATYTKETLFHQINEMSKHPERFCRNPDKDFKRSRKLDFATMMKFTILMQGGSIQKELYDYFGYEVGVATSSAFVQQRSKLLPEAFSFLFHNLNSAFPAPKLYKGYRLIACDGSDVPIAPNPNEKENYFQTKPGRRGYSKLHLHACYDLCNRKYTDAIIQPGVKFSEPGAMAQMLDRYQGMRETIFIADRGFESYNIMAHAHEHNLKFLIRTKDMTSNGILRKFSLPDKEEFDVNVSIILTRKYTKEFRAHPEKYRILHRDSPFDYFDDENAFYPISFRVARFKLSDGTYECVVTNLSESEFSAEDLKVLYYRRWGIETAFRELKYAIGLMNFHAKKPEYIKQEIFASLILHNICESIMLCVVIQKKKTKHLYQINCTMAINICRKFLRFTGDTPPPDVEGLIQKNLLPIRLERHGPRKVKHKSAVSFLYRVA